MALIFEPKNAFFDESGTHDQSDMVAVGGIVASYEALAGAEIEWGQVLKKQGIDFFHFTEFLARQPPYNWSDSDRDNFIERLATIISETATLGIACGILKTDYADIQMSLREEFRDIYHCCSYCCLDSIVRWKDNFKGPVLPKPIEFLFDRKPKFQGHACDIYYKVIKQVAGGDLFGDMGFGNKEKDIPLQMADLLVGAAIRHFRRQELHGLDVQPDRLFQRLNKKRRILFVWLTKDILLQFNDATTR